ncbi:glutaminyl-peptide cyclotransferase [Haematococcus lacustris]|uniref:Glutaminyl-peptide cyclotransferase n=1 Tax=Haematococcus lacustris TaxID=44745 RepID=A0A6A0AC29_HAELA|nr:glutaminyl-peptide cyclotransferase [Haematococcus lacustris]
MRRLQEQGDFFSDSAMRERAPLLHHQLLGHLGEADRAAQQAAGEDSDWLRKQFLQEMENRFLSGTETGVAYEDIDNDVDGVLDEHWRKEVQQDAEDRYFEDLESEEAAAEAPAHSNAPCDY